MVTQGEHTFEEEVLVSGEELQGFTADGALTLREPVTLSGDYQVSASQADGGSFRGVVMYDVADGEDVSIAADDCEVRIEVSEAVSPNDVLIPDGTGTFETVATSAASEGVAIAQESGSSGDIIEAYIFAIQGATA